jgi:hypothetical protein
VGQRPPSECGTHDRRQQRHGGDKQSPIGHCVDKSAAVLSKCSRRQRMGITKRYVGVEERPPDVQNRTIVPVVISDFTNQEFAGKTALTTTEALVEVNLLESQALQQTADSRSPILLGGSQNAIGQGGLLQLTFRLLAHLRFQIRVGGY